MVWFFSTFIRWIPWQFRGFNWRWTELFIFGTALFRCGNKNKTFSQPILSSLRMGVVPHSLLHYIVMRNAVFVRFLDSFPVRHDNWSVMRLRWDKESHMIKSDHKGYCKVAINYIIASVKYLTDFWVFVIGNVYELSVVVSVSFFAFCFFFPFFSPFRLTFLAYIFTSWQLKDMYRERNLMSAFRSFHWFFPLSSSPLPSLVPTSSSSSSLPTWRVLMCLAAFFLTQCHARVGRDTSSSSSCPSSSSSSSSLSIHNFNSRTRCCVVLRPASALWDRGSSATSLEKKRKMREESRRRGKKRERGGLVGRWVAMASENESACRSSW